MSPRHHSGTIPCPQCLSYETVIACSMCNGTGGIPDGMGEAPMTRATNGLVALVIALSVLVLALSGALLSGCGASALERHTMAAGVLHGATGVAASVVERRAEMAAESATPETIDAVQQRWERIAAGQRVVAASVDVYVAEVIAMGGRVAAGDDDDTRVLRALSEALSVYRALADMLAEYGVTLPSVARVLALVGGAL